MMRALLCRAFEGPQQLQLGELPLPEPGPLEIAVDVQAAALGFMDLLLVSGGYQLRPELPFVPGTDAAGRVAAVGSAVTGFVPGERVVASAWHGACAERMIAREDRCAPLPDDVPDVTAAAVPYAYLTAHHALAQRALLRAGETLLVTGAAGATGLAALDVGRLMGARTIACVGSSAKAPITRTYDADAVVDLSREDLRERVKELTDGRGLDVCFETVGGEVFLTLARVMAFGGRLLPIGFASGTIPELAMNLPLLKGYAVVGVYMGAWADSQPRAARAALDLLIAHVAAGRLVPHVDRVLPLAEAGGALRLVAGRRVQGRVILDLTL